MMVRAVVSWGSTHGCVADAAQTMGIMPSLDAALGDITLPNRIVCALTGPYALALPALWDLIKRLSLIS